MWELMTVASTVVLTGLGGSVYLELLRYTDAANMIMVIHVNVKTVK